MNSIGSGDGHAHFRTAVMSHLDAAYNLARWLTPNDSDAEDVVEDACLRAFRRIGSFSNGNARARLLMTVRQIAYAWFDENPPTTPLVSDDLEMFECAETACRGREWETPETAPVAEIEPTHLQAAIRRLPPPFRETLVLRDLQELNYKEIAEITEVPVSIVMTRLARARRHVMARIASDGG